MGINSGLSDRIKRNHMQQLAKYREEVLRPAPQLRTLFFELTALCNEHCRHCGSNCGDIKEVDALSLEEWKAVLDSVKRDFDISKLGLSITGGEPLLWPHFFELMEYADSLGFRWGMTSNGTLITKEVAHRLAGCGMRTISVSLDGLEETHDWFRESPGSFRKTMEGVQNLLDEGAFQHVQFTTVVHHRNIGELEELYRVVKASGVRSWRVINIEPIGRAKNNPELMLKGDEYKYVLDFIKKHRFEDGFEVCYGCSHYLGTEYEREVRDWYFLCNAGVYTASVLYNGDMTACLDIERRPELVEGSVRERSVKDIWESGYKIYRSDYRKAGKCASCSEYRFCAGDSFHTWDFDAMQPCICMKEILGK